MHAVALTNHFTTWLPRSRHPQSALTRKTPRPDARSRVRAIASWHAWEGLTAHVKANVTSITLRATANERSSLLDVPQRAAYSGNHWATKESAARGLATTGTGLNDN
jgi:hypothetical protein